MPAKTHDPNVNAALENIERMVAGEGGSLDAAEFVDEFKLAVRYRPGVNEECPECVPTADAVKTWLTFALKRQAPYVTEVEVS
jgi:hypothetical protein